MRKKLTLLFALLCVSMMGWATKYCGTALTGDNTGDRAGDALNDQLTFTASKVSANQTLFELTSGNRTLTGLFNGQAVLQNNGGGTVDGDFATGWTVVNNTLQKTVTWTAYPSSNIQVYLVANCDGAPNITGAQIFNIDVSSACSSKPSPELSLNATSKTLEKDVTAETFQIVPTKAEGSGAISYSSNATDVATVSETGLVTAVGNGTATITVSVAENASYAAESKTLTVEVIDWPNIGWLQNGENAYKLHISPAIGGTQRIEGSNLWVGFPDAVIGDISITPSGGDGAWRTFALSNFQGRRSQFTAVWQGNTYTFMVYRNFEGVNLAKGMPSTAGRDASNAWQSNDGNKGTRWGSGGGAKHYPQYGDVAEDWWVVDLGAFYDISSIKTLYEGAAPKNYSFYTSPNNDSWIEIDSYNATPNIGSTDADYNEYTYSPGKVGRYVKIFAREAVQANFGYGISIWEFEVYGQPAEGYDVNNPTLTSATLSGTPTTAQVQIAVSATDAEGAVTIYRVKDTDNGVDRNCTVAAGVITIDGLIEGTNYSFTVTALDAIGNQSNAIVVNATTAADPTMPQVMAPTPSSRSADDVRAIYSDAYTNILEHDFVPERTDWGSVSATRRVKDGNNYLLYDISSGTTIIWGSNDGEANAIVAKEGYRADAKTGVDASGMEYLHVDIWSLVALTNINVRINDDLFTAITHDGSGWQSYDLPMSGSAVDFTNIRWLKLDGIASSETRGYAAVDNYYFWKAPSGVKAVVVSSNNGSWGFATAQVAGEDVTSVPTGTEVTFAATAESGYDFAYWQIGETKVYDNPYVVEADANITAVATFEPSRTPYCAEPVTNAQSHTIYLTVKKTNNANEFMILLEGSSNTHITNVNDNIQFRLTHVNGSDEAHRFAQNEWSVDATGYGTAYATFTVTDFRAITISDRYIPLVTSNSGADEFYFPTNDASLVKWDATCTDDEAPELADPVASPLSGTSVRLSLSATDNMAALLTYNVNYKPTGDAGAGTDVPSFSGTAGETTTKDIQGLTAGVNYTFTVTVSDGTNTSEVKTCAATPSMPTAPVPTRNAAFVRSIYSNAYASVITSNYGKNSYSGISYQELNVGGDNFILYDYSTQKEIVWGADNENSDAILAATEYTDGVHKGLDVREMNYIHFDVYSTTATTYPNLYVQNTQFPYSVDGSGWQSFDIDISGLDPDVARSVTMLKFNDFRTPKPDEIAIDNVYFWSYGTQTTPVMGGDATTGGWATFSSPVKVAVPSGLTAYKATYSNEGGDEQLVLDAVSGAIPANEGVLLRGDADHVYTFSPTNDAAGDYTDNALVGCPARTDISSVAASNDIFCLRYSELYSLTGFFLYTGQYIPAGKVYLPIPKDPGGAGLPQRKIRFVFRNEQTTTGIENADAEAVQATKFMENGQLFIRRGDAVYTIQGARVK